MKPIRIATLALAVAAGLSAAAFAASQSGDLTPAQQKEIDDAREEVSRAAKRLAELHRKYGGAHAAHGMQWNQRTGAKPLIGVVLAPDAQSGVRIAGVTPEGPAAAAGIKSGDRLVSIGGKPITGDSGEARVENARKALGTLDTKTAVRLGYVRDGRNAEVSVTPKLDQRVMVFAGDGQFMNPGGGKVIVRRIGEGGGEGGDFDFDIDIAPGMMMFPDEPGMHAFAFANGQDGDAREVHTQVIRIDCKPGEECKHGPHRLAEAFRWNGLNLASVDPQLGRYFGTDDGVLVLSSSPLLPELQPGDVIRKVDGKPVATPRAVMDALRAKPAESSVSVDYLRDRKSGSAQIKVPKAMPIPHIPPIGPKAGAGAMPHTPGEPIVITKRKVVMIDDDGQVRTWEDDGEGPLPPEASEQRMN